MSPFDAARYARLSEGLEISEIRYSEALAGPARIDPEYFNRAALLALSRLQNPIPLGSMVKSGYRVVYESTAAIERTEGERLGLPYFLQSADINTPFINEESMVCVSEADWHRYPKGRINPGELLIEVKGKAEKVALVPEDFPRKTLVTGTCFKLSTHDELDQYFLAAYLTCSYGQILKNRLKTNLLVSYLSKDDLYGLAVPNASITLKTRIRETFKQCAAEEHRARLRIQNAEGELLDVLGLAAWSPPEALSYIRRSDEAFASGRLDAEFHQPKHATLHSELSARFTLLQLADIGRVTKGVTVEYFDGGEVPIIRSGDLGRFDQREGFLRSRAAEPIFYLQRGDVLISSIGFGSIGKVQVFDSDERCGTVSEVTVIRQHQLNPFYLAAFLRSIAGQMQIERFITGATGQLHLYPRDVAKFWVPHVPSADQQRFADLARQARDSKARAARLIDAAKRAVEITIEDSEAAALAYLDQVAPRVH